MDWLHAMSEIEKFSRLRSFYLTEYRPLYDRFVTEGASAQELHTEKALSFLKYVTCLEVGE